LARAASNVSKTNEILGDKYDIKQINVITTKQSGSEYEHSILDDMLLMIFEMILLYIILEIFEDKNRRKWHHYRKTIVKDENIVDPDVIKEKERVEEHMKCKNANRKLTLDKY